MSTNNGGWNPLFTREGREFLTGGTIFLAFMVFFITSVASCHQENADRRDMQIQREQKQMSDCLAKEISPDECYRLLHGHYASKDHIDG